MNLWLDESIEAMNMQYIATYHVLWYSFFMYRHEPTYCSYSETTHDVYLQCDVC